MVYADEYDYAFRNQSLARALTQISADHPGLDLNFIYNELEDYTTSANVHADNPYEALRLTVGLNPVNIAQKGSRFFIEAMQHGKYAYSGRAVGSDDEPVAGCTVLILAPADSTVITFGQTDGEGHFHIPCDRRDVLLKLSCVGYSTTYLSHPSFSVGVVRMAVLPVMLNGIKVEAENALTYADRTVYVPQARQKNAAANAYDLLRRMNMPQVRVSLSGDNVTDNFGESVSIFINYVKASHQELSAMRTSDVRRVEYLEFPTDPRFGGAKRVINIIVQEYEYGGYTRLALADELLAGNTASGTVFSKFNYRRMTYSLYAGASDRHSDHSGTTTDADYRLKNDAGEDYTLYRREENESSNYRNNRLPLTIRATYAKKGMTIYNTLGFTHNSTPANIFAGALIYRPLNSYNTSFNHSNTSRSNSVAYSGSFFFALPKKFRLNIAPEINYTHTNDHTLYESGPTTTVDRKAREDAREISAQINLSKSVNKHTFVLMLSGGVHGNTIHYSGTDNYKETYNNPYGYALLGYNLGLQKLFLDFDFGCVWEQNSINGHRTSDCYPGVHVNVQYAFDTHNRISTYFQYATNSPEIAEKTADVLKENEFMYYTGNPYLKNFRHTTATLAYTRIFSNSLSLTAYGKYYGAYGRMARIYEQYDGGAALLRRYVNSGNYYLETVGATANIQLFDNNLQCYLNAEQRWYRATGLTSGSYTPFRYSAEVNYYIGNFWLGVSIQNAQNELLFSAFRYIGRNFHSVSAGWSNGTWNVSVRASNFFNRGWVASTLDFSSDVYSEHKTTFGTSAHARIRLAATYTFDYGKKIKRSGEIGEQSGAASAILK